MARKQTLGFRVAPATRTLLEALARRDHVTLSAVANELLEAAARARIAQLAAGEGESVNPRRNGMPAARRRGDAG